VLVWGSAGKSNVIGDAGMQNCNVCGQTRSFYYIVNYTMRHIWYLIRWTSGRKYLQLCTTCHNGLPVEQSEIEAKNLTGEKAKNHIPFFDRMGWAIGLGVIALFIVFAGIAGNADKKEEAVLIAAPKAGDIYTINVEKFVGGDQMESNSVGGDYGAFRVAEVKGATVVLEVPKLIFSRAGGVRKDIGSGKTMQSDYYEGTMEVAISDMSKYIQDGAVYDIDRK
jgi:hypothetical protein